MSEEEKIETLYTPPKNTLGDRQKEAKEKHVERIKTPPRVKSPKDQKAKGLKIMTPNQLLTRLSILLAQKKQVIIVRNSIMK